MFEEAESDPRLSKEHVQAQEERLRTALLKAQYGRLQRGERSLLIVVAGLDGAGKGATVNLLNEWMDPRHIRTLAFGPPTPEEAARPPMWRYWNELPPRGRTGIVFGSWYGPLLCEAARKHPDTEALEARAEAVRRFEATLAGDGVQILKLWFHLSRKAQRERAERLLASRDTAWQVSPADLAVHRRFGRLRRAGQLAIEHTQAAHAPWLVIPSADDELRTLRTAEAVLHALRHPPAPPPVARPAARRVPDRLAAIDHGARLDKEEYEASLPAWQGKLARQVRRKKFAGRSLILVFEGQDAAGKGGTIRRVTPAFDVRRVGLFPISAPAPYERARPYLWRFWRQVPAPGHIAIFDRSWYGRVLVERVERLTRPADWRRAYGEINDFEAQLAEHGAIVLKFWLAVTPEEQLARFREREQSPFKSFKITEEDWRNRSKRDDYAQAANEMLVRTDTAHAPWHVLSSDDKRHARVEVVRRIAQALEKALD